MALVIGCDPMMFDSELRSGRNVYIIDDNDVEKIWTKCGNLSKCAVEDGSNGP